MNNDNDKVVNGRCAVFAWLGLAAIITIAATAGMAYGHVQTAIAVLAGNGVCSGLAAALATFSGQTKTGNVLAVTAALSAVAGLLVKEAETIRQMVTKPDTQLFIVAGAIILILALTWVFFSRNRENHEPRGRPEQRSPRTTDNKDEPDA